MTQPITWADIVRMYEDLGRAPWPHEVTIVGEAQWADMLLRSTDEERVAVQSLRENGSVIVSGLLPDGVAGKLIRELALREPGTKPGDLSTPSADA